MPLLSSPSSVTIEEPLEGPKGVLKEDEVLKFWIFSRIFIQTASGSSLPTNCKKEGVVNKGEKRARGIRSGP